MSSGNEVTVNVAGSSPISVSIPGMAGASASVAGTSGINVSVAGATGSPSVGGSQGISVTVPGSTASMPTITNGGTASVTITSVGDRGPKGDIGPATTLSIGQVTSGTTASATLTGPAGAQVLGLVLPKGDAGAAGKSVELQSTSTHLQWRLVGNSTWNNLVPLAWITGATVELQSTATHIQWRRVGDSAWQNIVALSAITGPQGIQGIQGIQGPPGSQGPPGEPGEPGPPGDALAIGTIDTGATPTASIVDGLLNITFPEGGGGGGGGIQWSTVPIAPGDIRGVAGDIARDSGYIYVCNGVGEWKRVALSTWTATDASFADVVLLLHMNGSLYSTTYVDSSSQAHTVTASGSGASQTGATGGRFSGGTYFDGSSLLESAYDADWDLGSSWTLELWLKIGLPEARTKIIGADGWGLFVTPQSEVDWGTPHRLEFIKFNSSGAIVDRDDCGPIQANTWTYVFRRPDEVYSGTTAGVAPSFSVGGQGFTGLSAHSSALTIGGDSDGCVTGYIDEVRITKGVSRPYPSIVPPAPFPDA